MYSIVFQRIAKLVILHAHVCLYNKKWILWYKNNFEQYIKITWLLYDIYIFLEIVLYFNSNYDKKWLSNKLTNIISNLHIYYWLDIIVKYKNE